MNKAKEMFDLACTNSLSESVRIYDEIILKIEECAKEGEFGCLFKINYKTTVCQSLLYNICKMLKDEGFKASSGRSFTEDIWYINIYWDERCILNLYKTIR